MIYLPRKVRDWYQDRADLTQENMGSHLIGVLIKYAFDNGLKCDHPLSFQVLHKKGKTRELNGKVVREPDSKRCTLCGVLWEVEKE